MTYKFDFHVHSKYSSDSVSDLGKILRRAKKRGLTGIAITDHDTISGAMRLRKLNKDNKLNIIIGIEVKTEYGDVIGLFLKEELKSRECFAAIKEIKSQGGIVVLPHPFKRNAEINPKLLAQVDAIEVFNSRLGKEQNQKARDLAERISKPMIGGSDAHLLSEIGNAYAIFDSISNLREKILEGNCAVGGILSSKYVHYISALIGNYRKGTLAKTLLKKVLE